MLDLGPEMASKSGGQAAMPTEPVPRAGCMVPQDAVLDAVQSIFHLAAELLDAFDPALHQFQEQLGAAGRQGPRASRDPQLVGGAQGMEPRGQEDPGRKPDPKRPHLARIGIVEGKIASHQEESLRIDLQAVSGLAPRKHLEGIVGEDPGAVKPREEARVADVGVDPEARLGHLLDIDLARSGSVQPE